MAIFGVNYNRAGPGVSKNEPKKKGFRRFIELIAREIQNLIKLNLLFCLIALPSAALFGLGFIGIGGVAVFALSVAATLPIGGAIAASMFCVAKMLRDEPGYLMYDFKRKFLENAKQAALPGMFTAVFTYMRLYIYGGIAFKTIWAGFGTIALLLVATVFFEMIVPYIFLQIAYLELNTAAILKNSVFLMVKNAPRGLRGFILSRIIWLLTLAFYPLSLWWAPLLPLIGFALMWLVNLMWIWPIVDTVFAIDATLKADRERQMGDISPVFASHEPWTPASRASHEP